MSGRAPSACAGQVALAKQHPRQHAPSPPERASGCFREVSAGPVCSSLSCAVTPSWRSKEFPAGLPGLKTCQADKVKSGNAMLEFVLNVVVLCERLEIV